MEEDAEHAGHSVVTVFMDDFDDRMATIASQGLEPSIRGTYRNGIRKALFHDPDANEIGFGGPPIPTGAPPFL
ncbi:hypothetical protein [Devosia sp.]|uniref:hypothetical protein n=1 Tax=Devosia sp. TaxID=1871048 RepID=UPI0026117037|nr:hypothetical protein [Devosia sp.]